MAERLKREEVKKLQTPRKFKVISAGSSKSDRTEHIRIGLLSFLLWTSQFLVVWSFPLLPPTFRSLPETL
jgi:hypothetical protein